MRTKSYSGLFFVLVCLLSSMLFCGGCSHARDDEIVGDRRKPEIPNYGLEHLGSAPNWRGIIPGKTTKQEVIEKIWYPSMSITCQIDELAIETVTWGEIVVDCTGGMTLYRFEEIKELRDDDGTFIGTTLIVNEVYFRNDVVFLIIEDTAIQQEDYLRLDDFMEKHGDPDRKTWSQSITGGKYMYWYCKDGLIVNTSGELIFWKLYFEPMPLNSCIENFEIWGPERQPKDNPFHE